MLDYAAAFVNFSGAFPNIEAVNASGPGAVDGTEFVANMINDSMWGWQQMLLNHAGLTPNGVVESASASQIKEALQKGFGGAPGTIVEWNLKDDPGTTGHRCLLLTGQGILRANYPDLDAAVYVGDGNNAGAAASSSKYYHADDAAGTIPNINGIYLILPDGRGYVPRGLDSTGTVDPGGAVRALGNIQTDAFQGHWHNVLTVSSQLYLTALFGVGAGGAVTTVASANAVIAKTIVTDGVNGTPRYTSETRAKNRATKFAIWY